MMSGPFSGGENVDFSGVCAANANLSLRQAKPSLRRAFACRPRPATGNALTGRCFRLYIRALAGAAPGLGLWHPDLFEIRFNGVRRFAPRAFRPGGCAYFRHRIPDAAMSRMLHVSGPVAGGRRGATKRKPAVHPGDVPAKSPVRGVPKNLWDKSGRIFLSSGRCFLWCVYGSAARFHGISDNGMGCIPPGVFPVQKAEPCPPEGEKRAVVYTGGMVMDACISVVKLAALCRRLCFWRRRLQNSNPEAGERPRGADCFKRRAMGPLRRRPGPPRQYGAIFCKVCHFIRSAPCKTGV